MLDSDKKIDGTFSERRTRPENKDEMLAAQRVYPPNLPATHAWDYRWEEPTPEALEKNRYLLPELVRGPRELTLSEIAARTKDFGTLGHGELRWLFERQNVKHLPLDKDKPKVDEVEGLRAAIRAHLAANTDKSTPNPKAVQSSRSQQQASSGVLPDDIAKMDDAAIETEAATMGTHEEYAKMAAKYGAGKGLPQKRAWLAEKRKEMANV